MDSFLIVSRYCFLYLIVLTYRLFIVLGSFAIPTPVPLEYGLKPWKSVSYVQRNGGLKVRQRNGTIELDVGRSYSVHLYLDQNTLQLLRVKHSKCCNGPNGWEYFDVDLTHLNIKIVKVYVAKNVYCASEERRVPYEAESFDLPLRADDPLMTDARRFWSPYDQTYLKVEHMPS